MSFSFQTLRSSSGGNIVTLWSPGTRLLIDAGIRSQRELRALLEQHAADPLPAALLVSHLHGDHINYASLRVCEQLALPIFVHEDNLPELLLRHANGKPFAQLELRGFNHDPFTIGDLMIRPFELPHDGTSRNCGFVISKAKTAGAKKIVLATDFYDWPPALEHFCDAEMIYVEANYCPKLLRIFPNPASEYHLANPETAALLTAVLEHSRRPPKVVVLGHLSEERNSPRRALNTIRKTVGKAAWERLNLHVAPRRTPSPIFRLEAGAASPVE